MPPIQRKFVEFKEEDKFDIEQVEQLARMGYSSQIVWGDLLKSKRILIVSEAGAGKSHECREQANLLYSQGAPAFYVELSELASRELGEIIPPEQKARFDDWKLGKIEGAVFFLDSIDELNLTTTSFATALACFRKGIGDNLHRVCIVLTSRPGPIDRKLVRDNLPILNPPSQASPAREFADIMVDREESSSATATDNAAPDWRYVGLAPLSHEQILQFAASEEVADPDKFLADIVDRDAVEFARRPFDLKELCYDWKGGNRTQNLRAQIERSVEMKLGVQTGRKELTPLSLEKARIGASRLALAAFLTRNFAIRHSKDSNSALSPVRVLGDWSDDEHRVLLERGLFSFASYGCVRFHHRSIAEYLAAERLQFLILRGLAIKDVKRQLFEDAYGGVKLIRPRMRPIAAWLAANNDSIFEEILDREPEVILDHADPSTLEIEQKKRALRTYVERYGQGGWRGMHVPQIQVLRFASPELAHEVQRLWGGRIENPDIRKFILDLIGAARLTSCATIAEHVAKDVKEDDGVRLRALRALTRTDRTIVAALILSMIADRAIWPDSLVEAAIPLLFPGDLTVDQLLRLVDRRQPSLHSHDSFEWVLANALSGAVLDVNHLLALCVGLKSLIEVGITSTKRWPHVEVKRADLILSLANTCLRLFDLNKFDSFILEAAILVVITAERSFRSEKSANAIKEKIGALLETEREIAFWLADAIVNRLHPIADPWHRLFEAEHRGPILLNLAQDRGWVLKILADTSRPTVERQMMLCAMTAFSRQSEDRIAYLSSLKIHVQDDADLALQLEGYLKPAPVNPEHEKHLREIQRHNAEGARKKEEARKSWAEFQIDIKENPEAAFSEKRWEDTAWSLWQAMQRSGAGHKDGGWAPSFVETHFGRDIVDRLRLVMRSIWRNHTPKLWHEKASEEKNQYLLVWEFGLAALHAEAESANWARHLTGPEAQLAARYAPIQLNGFPNWLESLAEAHPEAVELVLGDALVKELDGTFGVSAYSSMLQSVQHSPARVAVLFVPRLKDWLTRNLLKFSDRNKSHSKLGVLSQIVDILIAFDGNAATWLTTMAETALSDPPSMEISAIWLGALFRLNPIRGTEVFERQLTRAERVGDGCAIGWFAGLFGDIGKSQLDLTHAGFTPVVLAKLVRLAYRHVRPSEDIEHEGAFSPGPRDNAQRARNRLLGALLDARGPDAWRVKIEIAEDSLLVHIRDRLAAVAREKLAEEIDSTAVGEDEVLNLERGLDLGPKTRDQMFKTLQDRLDDLEDLLRRDDSPREAWALFEDERIMRREIARALGHAAREAYKVTQEEVTADEKETDIRLRSTVSDQQGVIEVKIGHREHWTGRILRDTLRKQIVKKYMAAENCRAGCLLVTVAKKNRTWDHPETGEALNIDGLRKMLEKEARDIEVEKGGSLRLFAKVLDLRPRLSKE